MKLLHLSFLIFFIFSTFCIHAQSWENTYSADSLFGSTGLNIGFKVEPAQDGGYFLAGEVDYPTGAPRHFIRLVKTDAFGNQEWSHTYKMGEIQQETVSFLKELPNGEILLIGNHDNRILFLKCNSLGEPILEKIFQSDTTHFVNDALVDVDGYVIIMGRTANPASTLFLLKTTLDGTQIWKKNHSFPAMPLPFSMDATPDGGYIISGGYSVGFDSKIQLTKVDSLGNLDWYQLYELSILDQAFSVKTTLDNGYIIGGSMQGIASAIPLIIKTDSMGTGEWTKVLAGGLFDHVADIHVLEDSTYLVTGTIQNFFSSNNNGFLGELDKEGEVIWMDDFSSSSISFSDVDLTLDGGIILAGKAAEGMLLKKIGGTLTAQKNIYQKNSIEVFPNPFQGQTIFKLENQGSKTIHLQIFDSTGKLMREETHHESEFVFYSKTLSSGIYFYKIKNENGLLGNGKFIISN